MAKKNRPKVTGITVYQRGQKWAYRLDIGEDPLTGKRLRENKSGFETDSEAWEAAIASKAQHDKGRRVAPSKRTVAEFLTEWLAIVQDSLKPSTYQNYVDYTDAYVRPVIGQRRLQDITVPVLNLFYRHLLKAGRRKPDNNSKMYEYWKVRRDHRDGLGPAPKELAKACKVTIYAARAAVMRYRRGRVPQPKTPGLAPKTVKNVHRMLHRALKDAVTWDYVTFNPAEHASLPRLGRKRRSRPKPWTVDELAAWLRIALTDRYAAMWLLAATTGMRRSELAGVRQDQLDLDKGTLTIEDTRVVVGGAPEDSDGKSEDSERTISLDPLTVAALRGYVEMLDKEREAFGTAYPEHGRLMCFEDGTLPHPDTITRWFNRLVDRAGVRRIRLHDIRHTYSTMALDHGIDGKIVSDRVGHANVNVTYQIYTHRSTGFDRDAAEQIADLIARAMKGDADEPATGDVPPG